MDLDDLQKLAEFYEVHPAALLLAPGDANPTITRMQRAASKAQAMSEKRAEAWLLLADPEPNEVKEA